MEEPDDGREQALARVYEEPRYLTRQRLNVQRWRSAYAPQGRKYAAL
jgi:hypothetical protein